MQVLVGFLQRFDTLCSLARLCNMRIEKILYHGACTPFLVSLLDVDASFAMPKLSLYNYTKAS